MFDKLDIQVTLLEKHGPVMALVLLTIDEVLIIRSIRVIKKKINFLLQCLVIKQMETRRIMFTAGTRHCSKS